jgi:ribosomal protein L7Ae-like RNA K-turn-binding protein
MSRTQQASQKTKSKKRSLPNTFLDCRSLDQVPSFPSTNEASEVISNEPISDVGKQIFLERLIKEVVQPFRPTRSTGHSFVVIDGKLQKKRTPVQHSSDTDEVATTKTKTIWQLRVRIGANQCLKALEGNAKADDCPEPALVVVAKDVYPPTMLAHVPVIARKRKIPFLILPGKASSELGKALGLRKTSIMLLLKSDARNAENKAMDSFIEFVECEIPRL